MEALLYEKWGKMPAMTKLIDADTIIMEFLSDEEVEEVIRCVEAPSSSLSSPFLVVDRWMEVIGSPPKPCWVRFSGVPLHAWREEILRLLGDCLGESLEVDRLTISKQILTHGRVKVLLGKVRKLSTQIPLWVGNLQVWVVAEEDKENPVVVEVDQVDRLRWVAKEIGWNSKPELESWRRKEMTSETEEMKSARGFQISKIPLRREV